jgi:hypothetical protein
MPKKDLRKQLMKKMKKLNLKKKSLMELFSLLTK